MEKIAEFQGEYRWLSNFARLEHPILLAGIKFNTAEHLYQALKSTNIVDFTSIASVNTPGKSKRLGKDIAIRTDWDDVKLIFMEFVLRLKFQDKKLQQKLLDTGDAILEEGNRWGDTFYGISLITGKGQNWLGKLLMKLRTEYRGNNHEHICA